MSTLNHEVYANGTTPLWLSATAGGKTTSPFNVVNNLSAPTTQTTIVDGNTAAGVYFARYGDSEQQAYAEVQFDIAPAVHLRTNGKDILSATSSNVVITTPIVLDNPQTSSVLNITTNAIGNFSNADATIQFGSDYVNLGTTAYVGAGDGLVVYDGGFSNYAEVLPTSFSFGQSENVPITTTETFTTAVIGGLGWTSQTGIPFDGYIWTSGNLNGDAQGGLTLTDPINSTKAVTNTGAPSSGKCAWLGGFPANVGGQYASFLEFPTITAPVGTEVQISWKQAGSVFSIDVYKNDVLFSTALNLPANRPTTSSWTTPPVMPFTFISTGYDNFFIQVQNPTGGSYTYTPYNIGDISITIRGQTEAENGSLSVTGDVGSSILKLANSYSPTTNFIELNPTSVNINADDGSSYVSSFSVQPTAIFLNNTNGSVSMNSAAIGLNATTSISAGATLNMTSNNIDNIGNVNAIQLFSLATYTNDIYPNSGFSNVTFQANVNLNHNNLLGCASIDNQEVGGILNIGNLTDFVNISNGSQFNTNYLDGNYGTPLTIGSNSAYISLSNVSVVNAKTTIGGGSLNNFATINNGAPLTQGLQLQYVVNWTGNKPNTMYIPPNSSYNVSCVSMFGGGFTGNDYIQTTGYVLPPRSVFKIYNSLTLVYTATNSNVSPQLFTNTFFAPSSSIQSYTLTPLVS